MLLIYRLFASAARTPSRNGFESRGLTFRRAIMVLPFVSLVDEVTRSLQHKLKPLNLIVRGFHGSVPVTLDTFHVAVCVLEKATTMVNKAFQEDQFHQFCCIVVDEVHMLGEPGRGFQV
jgi:DNA polymerase theta